MPSWLELRLAVDMIDEGASVGMAEVLWTTIKLAKMADESLNETFIPGR